MDPCVNNNLSHELSSTQYSRRLPRVLRSQCWRDWPELRMKFGQIVITQGKRLKRLCYFEGLFFETNKPGGPTTALVSNSQKHSYTYATQHPSWMRTCSVSQIFKSISKTFTRRYYINEIKGHLSFLKEHTAITVSLHTEVHFVIMLKSFTLF